MKKSQSKVVSLRLNEKIINEINQACEELEIDFSDFVRGAIQFSLKCRANKDKKKGGGKSTKTNKEWLEDYYKKYATDSAETAFNSFYDDYMKNK